MYRVNVYNRLTNECTNSAAIETRKEADKWIAGQESDPKPWGAYKGARKVDKNSDYPAELVESETATTVTLLPEYRYEIKDISDEIKVIKDKKDSLLATIDATDKPDWEKDLLKSLVK